MRGANSITARTSRVNCRRDAPLLITRVTGQVPIDETLAQLLPFLFFSALSFAQRAFVAFEILALADADIVRPYDFVA
jgi:hypothetical protein